MLFVKSEFTSVYNDGSVVDLMSPLPKVSSGFHGTMYFDTQRASTLKAYILCEVLRCVAVPNSGEHLYPYMESPTVAMLEILSPLAPLDRQETESPPWYSNRPSLAMNNHIARI
jgi:hypothetical protein